MDRRKAGRKGGCAAGFCGIYTFAPLHYHPSSLRQEPPYGRLRSETRLRAQSHGVAVTAPLKGSFCSAKLQFIVQLSTASNAIKAMPGSPKVPEIRVVAALMGK